MDPPCRLGQIDHVCSHDHAEEFAVDNCRGVNSLDSLELEASVPHFPGNHERSVVGGILGERPKDPHAFPGFNKSDRVIPAGFGLVALSEQVLGPVQLVLQTVRDAG